RRVSFGFDPAARTGRPLHSSRLPDLEHSFWRDVREQLHQAGDDPCPSGLMARAKSGSIVAVKVLIEEEQIPPLRILLQLSGAPVDWPPALPVVEENAREPPHKLRGNFVQRQLPS